VVAQGTHKELLADSPIYQEIYDSQLGNGFHADGTGAGDRRERDDMSFQSGSSTSSGPSMMQPRRPADPGKIEKAKDPRRAVKGLLRFLLPFKTGMLIVLGLVLIYTVLGLIGPYLMGPGD